MITFAQIFDSDQDQHASLDLDTLIVFLKYLLVNSPGAYVIPEGMNLNFWKHV